MKRTPLLSVAVGPHRHLGLSVTEVYLHQTLALLPAAVGGVWLWGLAGLRTLLLAVGATIVLEWLTGRLMGRESSVRDGSAILQGLLLGLLLHAGVPWWLVAIGAVLLVVLGKQFFGGLGGYPLNPVLLAYAILLVSWPGRLNAAQQLAGISLDRLPLEPLVAWRNFGAGGVDAFGWSDLLLGQQVGGIGAGMGLLLALGGLYLILRGFIAWRIPLAFLASVALLAGVFHLADPVAYAPPWFHLCAGMVVLAAFFLATDFTTAPVNGWAQVIYGVGCGVLVVLIRTWGSYPDGTVFAVLLMNLFHPLIDKLHRAPALAEVPLQ